MDGLYKYFGLRKDKRPQLRLFIQAAGPTTHAAQPAGSSNQAAEPPQPVTPGLIRSNRTVTRDLKRQECKEILLYNERRYLDIKSEMTSTTRIRRLLSILMS